MTEELKQQLEDELNSHIQYIQSYGYNYTTFKNWISERIETSEFNASEWIDLYHEFAVVVATTSINSIGDWFSETNMAKAKILKDLELTYSNTDSVNDDLKEFFHIDAKFILDSLKSKGLEIRFMSPTLENHKYMIDKKKKLSKNK